MDKSNCPEAFAKWLISELVREIVTEVLALAQHKSLLMPIRLPPE